MNVPFVRLVDVGAIDRIPHSIVKVSIPLIRVGVPLRKSGRDPGSMIRHGWHQLALFFPRTTRKTPTGGRRHIVRHPLNVVIEMLFKVFGTDIVQDRDQPDIAVFHPHRLHHVSTAEVSSLMAVDTGQPPRLGVEGIRAIP